MTQTITALYDTYDGAVAAVKELEASGIPHADISLVSNNVDHRYDKHHPTKAAADAGTGAGIGATVGGVGGLLTGLGLLAIPGVGPVVAAGWLVGLDARFVKNRTLSQRGTEISDFHKRSFAQGDRARRRNLGDCLSKPFFRICPKGNYQANASLACYFEQIVR